MVVLEIVNKKAPKVGGTKITNDAPLDVKAPLPGWNFASLVVGTPGSGKTSLILALMKKYYKKKFDRVYFFSGSLQTIPESFLEKLNEERIYSGLEQLEEVVKDIKEDEEKPRCCIIIDDLVKDVMEYHKTVMNLLFNRRHIGGGCSVFLITQKLTKIPLGVRSGFDTIYFFSLNNKKELNSLYEDFITDLDRKEFDEMIKYVMDKKVSHPFLFIDKKNGDYYLKFNRLVIKSNDIVEDASPDGASIKLPNKEIQ
jgi:hypothetical protein